MLGEVHRWLAVRCGQRYTGCVDASSPYERLLERCGQRCTCCVDASSPYERLHAVWCWAMTREEVACWLRCLWRQAVCRSSGWCEGGESVINSRRVEQTGWCVGHREGWWKRVHDDARRTNTRRTNTRQGTVRDEIKRRAVDCYGIGQARRPGALSGQVPEGRLAHDHRMKAERRLS